MITATLKKKTINWVGSLIVLEVQYMIIMMEGMVACRKCGAEVVIERSTSCRQQEVD